MYIFIVLTSSPSELYIILKCIHFKIYLLNNYIMYHRLHTNVLVQNYITKSLTQDKLCSHRMTNRFRPL